jgi:putative flippase GtrA
MEVLLIRFIAIIDGHPRLSRWSAWLAGLPLVGRFWIGLRSNPKEMERFVKFAIVGTIGFLVDLTVLNVMKRLFEAISLGSAWNLSMEPRQFQLAVANTISFSAAVLSNFTWNRLWTFPESRERALSRQLLQFAIVNVLGWCINTVLLLVMDQYVFQHFVGTRMSYNLAKAIATIVVLFWNFGLNRVWTYGGIK